MAGVDLSTEPARGRPGDFIEKSDNVRGLSIGPEDLIEKSDKVRGFSIVQQHNKLL